mgnify:CR=1 FL=1
MATLDVLPALGSRRSVFDAESGQCAGVSMTQLLDASNPGYLDAFPSLDRVRNVSVVVAVADRA